MTTRTAPTVLGAALLAVFAIGPAPAAAVVGNRASTYTGRVLVLVSPGTRSSRRPRARAAAVSAFLARTGARPAGPVVPEIGLITVRPPAGVSFGTYARRLRASDPAVRTVERERRFSLRLIPNDPALTTLEPSPAVPPGTALQWWPAREDFPRAWDISQGDGALVGLIDTGVDTGHPDLAGKVRAVVNLDANQADGPAGTDAVGHGTHVGSLACAASNNGIGLAGAGMNCGLIVEKSDLTDASVAQAIVDATNRGVDAINMSFGTDASQPPAQTVVDSIDYAYSHNVVMAAAAADSPVTDQGAPGNVLQPAGTGSDITQGKGLDVTAANFAGQRAAFAGSGGEISIAAFGAFANPAPAGGLLGGPPSPPPGIFAAFPANPTAIESGAVVPQQPPCSRCRTTLSGDNRYAYLQGTSMATPMVSAVAALMHHLNPDLSAGETIRILKQTAQRPPNGGWTPDLGWGILDAGAAMDAARLVDHRAPVSRLTAPHTVRGIHIRLQWTGTDPAAPGTIASGIDHYEVWRGANGRRPARIAVTPATSLVVRARAGSRYSFFTLAVDHAGNREAAPTHIARTRVARKRHTRDHRRAGRSRRRRSSGAR